jgi:hypothetical protein
MGKMTAIPAGSVEFFSPIVHASEATDELNKLLGMLKNACPEATAIRFDFDGKLRVHIDVRSRSDVAMIEAILPALGRGGTFYGLTLGATPHHPFHHRISALVDR